MHAGSPGQLACRPRQTPMEQLLQIALHHDQDTRCVCHVLYKSDRRISDALVGARLSRYAHDCANA